MIQDSEKPGGKKKTGPAGPAKREKEDKRQEQRKEHLRKRCLRLLALLRRWCPDMLPPEPLPEGRVGPLIELKSSTVSRLVRDALLPEEGPKSVIWQQAGSEVVAHLDRTRVQVLDGLVLIGITLESEETGPAELTVPFAVGTPDRLAGMITVTEEKPRGPAILADRWGEAVIATAWKALMDVADHLAAEAGTDEMGAPLRSGALVTEGDRLGVVPQARHSFERVAR